MSNNNVNNVSAGKPKINGSIFRAPLTASLPTNATSSLSEDYKNLGYVSTDGMINSNTRSSTNIKSWEGDTVMVVQSDRNDTFKATMIESLNVDTLKAVHGDANVTGAIGTGITIKVNADEDESHVYVIDMEMRGNTKKRIVIPSGVISEIGDVVYKSNDVVGYPITITALPDSENNSHYEYVVSPGDTPGT